MCLDLSWDVSVASAEVRMSLSSPKQSQRGCWRTLSPGPATAQHGNFDDEMKSAEAVKSWFDIFCENCEIDWHTNSIVENHIHHIRSRSFYCVKSQCLLRSRVYFISIPDAVIIEVQVGPRRTVHVQFASHTLHQFENQFECRMKWYEMIWNDMKWMKWYEMKEIIVRTYPKMSQVYDVTLCDTLRWEMCRRRDWISRCCKLWSGCIGCGVEIGQFAVQFDMNRLSICWTERVPRESKRGIAGIASCARYFTVLPLLRRGQWEVWWRSCRGPSIRFHDDRL